MKTKSLYMCLQSRLLDIAYMLGMSLHVIVVIVAGENLNKNGQRLFSGKN